MQIPVGRTLVAALVLTAALAAQDAPTVHLAPTHRPGDDDSAARTRAIKKNVDLVLVPVTVTDAKNHPIVGLEKQHFALSEDDIPQPIRYFSAEDAPTSLGVILDLSASMKNKIAIAREAVAEFFATANPQDDYFVVTFADRPALLADSTRSIGDIRQKLATAVPQGHTALLDAIYLGVEKMRHARHQRRALLVVSDGGDNHSRFNERELRRLVQEADVEIYAIGIFEGIFKTPEEWYGKRTLQRITEATGGRTITVDNAAQLPDAAQAISEELRNQYILGYEPRHASGDGRLRRIRVKLTDAVNAATMAVYSKRGYFAGGE